MAFADGGPRATRILHAKRALSRVRRDSGGLPTRRKKRDKWGTPIYSERRMDQSPREILRTARPCHSRCLRCRGK